MPQPIQPPATIAFIGLGQMGLPMTARLLDAGFKVNGYDLSDAARAAFASSGGMVSRSPSDAAKEAAVVVTMLPTGAVVRDALLGADGALLAAASGTLIIDMSSSAPMDTRRLGEDLAARGFRLIDAPVSGGVRRAVDGSLTIMVGGDVADAAQAESLFKAMGKSVFPTGKLGSGHAMKALNNYVSGAGAVAAMEALIVGRAFGLDPALMVDILNVSTGRNNTTEVKLKQFVLSESFASGFAMGLMAKDIRMAADLASALDLDTNLLVETADIWDRAAVNERKGADHTEMFRFLAAAAQSRTE